MVHGMTETINRSDDQRRLEGIQRTAMKLYAVALVCLLAVVVR